MNFIRNLWSKVKPRAVAELLAKEPAISAGAGALAASVATHYGLHLDPTQQAWVSGGVLFILNWIVRQCVAPVTDAAIRSRIRTQVDTEPEPVVIHASDVHVHHHHPIVETPPHGPKKRTTRKAAPRKR
jgi:hypothetical protein